MTPYSAPGFQVIPGQGGWRCLNGQKEDRGTTDSAFTGTAMVRLKALFNVKCAWDGDTPSFSYGGDSLADARAAKAKIIQWLPAQATVPCTLLTQDGTLTGACEPAVMNEVGKVVQFERVGFAKIDSAGADGVLAYFTHK
jgi:glutamyl-tRNA synthetase